MLLPNHIHTREKHPGYLGSEYFSKRGFFETGAFFYEKWLALTKNHP